MFDFGLQLCRNAFQMNLAHTHRGTVMEKLIAVTLYSFSSV